MKTPATLLLVILMTPAFAVAADYPQAQIANGLLVAKVLLPDAQNGYYRGTRFDWGGAISSLVFNGHDYFGKWFDHYDPKIHDAIMGPVEEFMAVGYEDAKMGDTFVKIGVGVLRRQDEKAFEYFRPYEIVDNGKWTIERGASFVEFAQELSDSNGYAYLYRKTVRLVPGKPEMVLEHSLRNTGKKMIVTRVYNHNFFVLDHQPVGPDYSVRFPFEVHEQTDLQGVAVVRGKELTYPKELQDGQRVRTELGGFGNTPRDYDIRVENRKAGIGVRYTSDRPTTKIVFWSIRNTICPQPYIDLKADPGQEEKWRINYAFYTLASRH